MELATYFVALFNYGGLVAGKTIAAGARQHLFSPKWPPHAKLHNGQTMAMGVIGGLLSLAILFGSRLLILSPFLVAAAIAANYFVAWPSLRRSSARPRAIPSSRLSCRVRWSSTHNRSPPMLCARLRWSRLSSRRWFQARTGGRRRSENSDRDPD